MSARISWPAVVGQAAEIARRLGHDVLIMLLVLLLGALAMIASVAWLAQHLIVFAGVAPLIWGVFYLGRREQTRARPGQIQPRQVQPKEPAAALPAATLLLTDYGQDGELTDEQSARWAHKTRLIAGPLSGAHQFRRPS